MFWLFLVTYISVLNKIFIITYTNVSKHCFIITNTTAHKDFFLVTYIFFEMIINTNVHKQISNGSLHLLTQ